jgi:L-asparaginase
MVDTAKFLEDIEDKTIVLTGAMQPARFKKTDAVFNSGFAFAAALSLDEGIYIAMSGRIFSSDNVRKNIDLGKFENKS